MIRDPLDHRPVDPPPFAEMGASPQMHWQIDQAQRDASHRARHERGFVSGYQQGWGWGFICGVCFTTCLWALVYVAWSAWPLV